MVPAFNEAESIPALFKLISDFGASVKFHVTLLIIENGSRDSTRKIIYEQTSRYSNLNTTILELDSNIGYGGALKKGIAHAESQVVALLPADGKYQLADIQRVFQSFPLDGNDTVMVKGLRVSRNDPRTVQFLSRMLTLISNALLGTSLKDVNGLPKVFNRSPILGELSIVPNDGCFDFGLIAIWNRGGRDFHEIPVTFTQKNLSEASWAGQKFKTSVRVLLRVIGFSFRLKREGG